MNVLPQDPGFATLTMALMKLSEAESRAALMNKQMYLEQLQRNTELGRQTGNKQWVEELTGRPVTIKNQLQEAAPVTALDTLINARQQGAQLPTPKSIAELKSMQDAGQGADLEAVSNLANTPQSIAQEQKASQWKKYGKNENLNYASAGDAMQQTLDNFYSSIEGKNAANPEDRNYIVKNYNKTAAQLQDIGVTYRRPLTGAELPPLKVLLAGGGAAKPQEYRIQSGKKWGGQEFGFTSYGTPGTAQYDRDLLEAGKKYIDPKFQLTDAYGPRKMGTGPTQLIPEKELATYAADAELNAQKVFDDISNSDASSAEKLQLIKQRALDLGVIYKPKKDVFGNIVVSDIKFNPRAINSPSEGTTWGKDIIDLVGAGPRAINQAVQFFSRQKPAATRRPQNIDAAEEQLRRQLKMK